MTKANEENPKPNSIWRHKKGGLYRIICCAIQESDLTPVVVYYNEVTDEQPNQTVKTWTRPLAQFMDGRFTLIERND